MTLTATPNAGSTFLGWTGEGCSGTGTCTVTMTQARNVVATFGLVPTNTLTVVRAGAGTGTVTSNPAGINCGVDCTESVRPEHVGDVDRDGGDRIDVLRLERRRLQRHRYVRRGDDAGAERHGDVHDHALHVDRDARPEPERAR